MSNFWGALHQDDFILVDVRNAPPHLKKSKIAGAVEIPLNVLKDWKIFENTHEPIIDQEIFDVVQKIRNGRRRRTKMGEMPLFSGLLYCADCGAKLSYSRDVNSPAETHNYMCSNYRHKTRNCSMHYIRNTVVEKIVLENLREVTQYVSNYEDEFLKMVMDVDLKQKNKELAQKKSDLVKWKFVFLNLIHFSKDYMKITL